MTALKFLAWGALIYAAFCTALYLAQRSLIYYPDKTLPDLPTGPGADFIQVTTRDGLSLKGWYSPAEPGRHTILYFHGNAGSIEQRLPLFDAHIKAGYGVLMAEYRGYGGNPGHPSEQGLYHDARAYLDYLLSAQNIPPGRIVLYGESIGTGPAIQLAYEHPDLAAVLLITPFASLSDVARRALPIIPLKGLLKDRFDNIAKVQDLPMPLYFFIAEADEFIPAQSVHSLYAAARGPKERFIFDGVTHNAIHDDPLIAAVADVLAGL